VTFSVSRERERNQREEEDGSDGWVPHVSEGKGKITVPIRVFKMGCGLVSLLGRKSSPGSKSIFISSLFLFFFCFLKSFKHFSNLTQIDPNQLCKVSKIQNNHTEQ
jgi:hypothetical protein